MDIEQRIESLLIKAVRANAQADERVSDYGRGLLHGMADGYRLVAEWLAEDNNIKV